MLKKKEKSASPLFSTPESLHHSLLEEAIDDLRKEIESPLEPYPDWSEPLPDPADEVPPNCFPGKIKDPFHRELKKFLRDPDVEVYRCRQRKDIREMLETYIRHNRLDLDLRTERSGTPHTLVCTKNMQSYHAAVARRKEDRKLLASLVKVKS